MEFGKRVALIRKTAGKDGGLLTQKALKKATKISQSRMSRFEKGEDKVHFTFEEFRKLVMTLKTTADHLLGLDDDIPLQKYVRQDPLAQELVTVFKKLDPGFKKLLLKQARLLLAHQRNPDKTTLT